MTAINHALTGAFIGFAVSNPAVAAPAAFLSHFVCDAIPHYDVTGSTDAKRIGSRMFLYIQIVGGAVLCVMLVLGLAILQPRHWLIAAVCAFLAASPDLLYIPRFINVKRTGKDNVEQYWFWRFHNKIQWFQKPIGGVVEIAWFIGILMLVRPFLH
ncbi:MAG TPA: hypothetical protein VLG37_02645 [Candidatus Saccharimonadales bacterium]|nr:hypothetical protein [Candidatus Saccharimonadales bacterium]